LSQPAGFSPRAVFQLFRHSQGIVQKRPEIGLDDIELTLRYGDLVRKIVDNDRAGASDRIATMPRQLGTPKTLSAAAFGQTPSALNLSLPGWAGCLNRRTERSSTANARTAPVQVKGC
jgi:hypothetical protein